MDFSNWVFWVLALPSVCIMNILCRLIQNDHHRASVSKWMLCLLNLALLGTVNIETLIIFLLVTLFAYACCCFLDNKRRGIKTGFLWVIIPILLLPLIYYKYANFIASELTGKEYDTLKDIIIPIGISFYTFQVIAFCIDTLKRNQRVPAFIDYMNFCSFFPQIVAGPIERKESLLPQMESWRCRLTSHSVAEGIPYIVLGLFFKLALADNLALAMHIGYTGENAIQIWMNNIVFGFRIYFDFAGYGLSAYGVAKCLGVNITMNFMSPYTCSNVSDFWRKWHISLTLWFRDYIYFSLGGSRTKFWWFNIIFMFLVSGVWHGAGWNFIIWGGLAGITMVVHRIFRNFCIHIPSFAGWMLTMVTMMFIWMFFYETNMDIIQKNLFCICDLSKYDFREFIDILNNYILTGARVLFFVPISLLIVLAEYISIKKNNHPYAIFLTPQACMLLVILISMLHSEQQSQFIYFAF